MPAAGTETTALAVVSIYTFPFIPLSATASLFRQPVPGLIGCLRRPAGRLRRFRCKCRIAGHRHRDPNCRAGANPAASFAGNVAGYGSGCFVEKPAIPVAVRWLVALATWPAFARAPAGRTAQSRRGRARPGDCAWCAQTRRRAAADDRGASGGGRRRASAPWRVGWGKAPPGPWRAVGARSTLLGRKAFHLLCRDRRSRSFLSSGYGHPVSQWP